MCSYLDGLMIGDGSIAMHGKTGARLQIGRQVAHAGYNTWLMEKLSRFSWYEPWHHTTISTIDGRMIKGNQHRIRTASSTELAQEHMRWYSQGVRKVPRDFHWTPESLAVAFMDDGSLSAMVIRSKSKTQLTAIAQLYLCNYSQAEVQALAAGIRNLFGIKCSVQQNRNRPLISFSGIPQVRHLVELIKPVVLNVPVMAYKIALDDKLADKAEALGL